MDYDAEKPALSWPNPNQDITMTDTNGTLTPLPKFKNSGRCPVEPYHLICRNKQSLVDFGAIVPFGRLWLVDEPRFHDWFREYAKKNSKGEINV